MNSRSTFTFRAAEKTDLDAINRIYNYEVLNGTATFDTKERSFEKAFEWFSSHNTKSHLIEVCTDDMGRVIAYCSLSSYRDKDAFDTTAEISIYVDAKHQKKGIGYMLCKRMLDHAKNTGCLKNIIAVITSDNTASIKLFKKLGFTFGGTIECAGIKFNKELGITNFYKIL